MKRMLLLQNKSCNIKIVADYAIRVAASYNVCDCEETCVIHCCRKIKKNI